ncbi:hypothetical protein LSH36_950g00038 [Paralvinella palmiformis]|uniref:FAD dependent oxidoreductase domain-containing protein n=1 Tax=Paralvinella palmiformis TaxID=53620 RepID=A0AAD9MTJ2_9ANNE|nr:hypothetical protein LSH36_950g00038 [Paralvinella palmiformis]
MLRGSKGHTILVLGAGVVGLSTAINSYITWPDADVTVMADTFYSGTTSYGAGGIFRPTFDKLPGVPESMLRHGFFVTTLMTEGYKYMSYLMKRFEDMGGSYVKRKIYSVEEVKAPWIKQSLLFGDEQLTFIYPGQEYCVIGCTRQKGDYNLTVDQSETEKMWKEACSLMPSLSVSMETPEI